MNNQTSIVHITPNLNPIDMRRDVKAMFQMANMPEKRKWVCAIIRDGHCIDVRPSINAASMMANLVTLELIDEHSQILFFDSFGETDENGKPTDTIAQARLTRLLTERWMQKEFLSRIEPRVHRNLGVFNRSTPPVPLIDDEYSVMIGMSLLPSFSYYADNFMLGELTFDELANTPYYDFISKLTGSKKLTWTTPERHTYDSK